MKTFVKFMLITVMAALTIGMSTVGSEARPRKAAGIEQSVPAVAVTKHRKHTHKKTKRHRHKQAARSYVEQAGKAFDQATAAAIATTAKFTDLGRRPGRWCGWYMRTLYGGSSAFNRAWAWTKRGVATLPQPGAIIVWPHHVGVLVGPTAAPGVWLVHSGNDGGRVRTRPRRIAGAVFRAL